MSTSPEMAKGKTLTELRQPEEGFTGHHGFYIHVFMPADDRQNRFSFIYGVIHYLSTGLYQSDVFCSVEKRWLIITPDVLSEFRIVQLI